MTQSTSSRLRAASLGCAVAAAVAGLSVISPAPAHADDSNNLPVTYDAVGSTHLAKTNSDVALGPTTLSTSLSPADGSFTGHLPLPSAQASFKALGLLPVTATVSFIEAAPVTGKLTTTGTKQSVTSTASYYIALSNVKVAGLPAFVGSSCRTAQPATIPANTPAGGSFNITTGGTLTGTYTLPKFANCGLTTGLINLLVPGAGNTVSLTVSNGRIG